MSDKIRPIGIDYTDAPVQLPWTAHDVGADEIRERLEYHAGVLIVGSIVPGETEDDDEVSIAAICDHYHTAAMIVRAVNSFDELVAACYSAEQALLHGNGGQQADAAFKCQAALQKARTP